VNYKSEENLIKKKKGFSKYMIICYCICGNCLSK